MEKEINRNLIQGFAKILDKKQSVTLLCEKSGISRATFYLYCKDFDEFKEKTLTYIIEKYFKQIGRIMFCSEEETERLLKRDKLLLNDAEIKLLSYFASGKNYITFANKACEKALPDFRELCKEKFGEEFFEQNEYRITYCLNGMANVVFFNLVSFDEKKMLFEIKQSRKIMRTVLGQNFNW